MQGIYITGRRPKSKKELREAIAGGSTVYIEGTDWFGRDYSGDVENMPEGQTIYFVGPDPFTARKFYGQLVRKGDKITVR